MALAMVALAASCARSQGYNIHSKQEDSPSRIFVICRRGVDTGKRTGVANAIIRELKITEIENLLTLSFEVYCIL